MFVLPTGEVDGGCEGKNAWDKTLRDLVPKILDLSVVNWMQHQPHTLQKLRDALNQEFKYIPKPLSMVGFRTYVTRFLKSKRSRLKSKWLKSKAKGPVPAPLRVDPKQWERLIAYWNTDAQ